MTLRQVMHCLVMAGLVPAISLHPAQPVRR